MSWIKVESHAVAKRSSIGLKLAVIKGVGRLIFTVPTTLSSALGLDAKGIEACDVHIGANEHEGKAWVEPKTDGQFKLGRLKHCITLRIPPPKGLPLKEQQEDLSYERADPGFVVTLPEWAVPGASGAPAIVAADKPASLEFKGNTIILGAREITLSPQEAKIMRVLEGNFGKCVASSTLLDELYQLDPNGGAQPKVLDVFISRLRSKLKDAGFPLSIITHRAHGFELRRAVT